MTGSKNWYIYTIEYYIAERKKELLPFRDSMDGTGHHYAKGNKPMVKDKHIGSHV